MGDYSIVELSEKNWRDYKLIRLQSLQDSPDSFASTYERESLFEEKQWKARLRVSSSIHDAVALSAVVDGSYVGLVSSVIHKPNSSDAHIYQMWVAPEHRGCGIGTVLLDELKTWANSREIEKLSLSVTTVNSAAISLYRKQGFKLIGDLEPLRPGSSLNCQSMTLCIKASDK